jgi:hypothetical protein
VHNLKIGASGLLFLLCAWLWPLRVEGKSAAA